MPAKGLYQLNEGSSWVRSEGVIPAFLNDYAQIYFKNDEHYIFNNTLVFDACCLSGLRYRFKQGYNEPALRMDRIDLDQLDHTLTMDEINYLRKACHAGWSWLDIPQELQQSLVDVLRKRQHMPYGYNNFVQRFSNMYSPYPIQTLSDSLTIFVDQSLKEIDTTNHSTVVLLDGSNYIYNTLAEKVRLLVLVALHLGDYERVAAMIDIVKRCISPITEEDVKRYPMQIDEAKPTHKLSL